MPNVDHHSPDSTIELVVNDHGALDPGRSSAYELRSEEVQDIMTQMPSWIIRQGTTVLFTVMAILLMAAYYIHFPDVVSTHVHIKPVTREYTYGKDQQELKYEAIATLPLKLVEKVKTGQEVLIKLPLYPFGEFGYLQGRVEAIYVTSDTSTDHAIKITLQNGLVTSTNKTINGNVPLIGTAEILTSNKSILDRVVDTFRSR